ncbi:ubiquinone biosynthesis accessory factor UbiJ [Alteromonas flava]|uniref:ubiquinone biosynthesis accessory factor UbiJ n=1 Tax=Alteromonas flava TaxID=2048003 RepID=UPI000C292A3D|nr:SCP2 sterol-binding domain-containing protein [Alteromonas flava]
MPTAQVLHAIAEAVVNPLLKLDPESQARIDKLRGKRLIIWLDELAWPVEMVFEQTLSIHQSELSWEQAQAALSDEQCLLKTALSVLPELKDTRKITQLIRANKLDLCGDMQIAQHVSQLFLQLSIDWEEVLSQHIGDVPAYQIMRGLERANHQAKQHASQLGEIISTALIDEKRLAVHRLQVLHHGDQVSDIRDAVARLESRIQRLESK